MPGTAAHAEDGSSKRRRVSASLTSATPVNIQGLVTTDHEITVPLDHTGKLSGEIKIFARECVATAKKASTTLPYLLFLQGAP